MNNPLFSVDPRIQAILQAGAKKAADQERQRKERERERKLKEALAPQHRRWGLKE